MSMQTWNSLSSERKPGTSTKPACDGAICAIVLCDLGIKPLILYEYKPTVDHRCDHVNRHDLMEALIHDKHFTASTNTVSVQFMYADKG